MNVIDRSDPDHYFTYGDVYEAIDACEHLEMMLGRLKRQHLITETDWSQIRERVEDIRHRIERPIAVAG